MPVTTASSEQSLRKPCCCPDNEGPFDTNVQRSPGSGNSPEGEREPTATPGCGQEPALGFPRPGQRARALQGQQSNRVPGRPRESVETCHLHFQLQSIFLWPWCWKLRGLMAGSPGPTGCSEEGPPSLWENTLRVHVLCVYRKQTSSRTRCSDRRAGG